MAPCSRTVLQAGIINVEGSARGASAIIIGGNLIRSPALLPLIRSIMPL